MEGLRVRFAPSPTGPLHIGGVRVALYDYLLAKKHNGSFILRIEDTDQMRYVEGAEDHIKNSLEWVGLIPDEGPGYGGNHGPYRQSERKEIYQKYTQQLVDGGYAYYAFDTPEELDAMRERLKDEGVHSPKYDRSVRLQMRNSISLSEAEVKDLLNGDTPYTIRLKVPENEEIIINDTIRGDVTFNSNELDDKVLIKADGLPTYHLANVVDDKLMEISHVIRGEEWLSSTAHHIIMYRAFGWGDHIPAFAHLPLILKPTGKGKLSKRDGAKFGFPVFPLSWQGETEEDSFDGFMEYGFDPDAVNNFLAFLGWNPGTEQEIFSKKELIDSFSLEQVNKSGARFDYDKARWFNEQYLHAKSNFQIVTEIKDQAEKAGYKVSSDFLEQVAGMMKTRVTFSKDIITEGYYFFEDVKNYDEKNVTKRWTPEIRTHFSQLANNVNNISSFDRESLENVVKGYIADNELKFGQIFPLLRIALAGTMKGPDLFDMMTVLGRKTVHSRLCNSLDIFDQFANNNNG